MLAFLGRCNKEFHLSYMGLLKRRNVAQLYAEARVGACGFHKLAELVGRLTWNERPVLSSSTSTNWKYWSMDHSDSTAPSAYSTKNLSAAGVKISYAKSSLRCTAGGRARAHRGHGTQAAPFFIRVAGVTSTTDP